MADSDWKDSARPDAVRSALHEHEHELQHASTVHQHSSAQSVRTAFHRGHEIEIWTSYRITVDGQPFAITAGVDNAGRVHYHGLPTRDFTSTVDLVKEAIDTFPDDFPNGGTPGAHEHTEPVELPHVDRRDAHEDLHHHVHQHDDVEGPQ